MKRLLALLFLLSPLLLLSQVNGNEWIDYSRLHYKFPITKEGIYRITYQDLQNANIPVNSILPSEFRVFGKGEEIPIYIPNESDNSFDNTDFIEFYAEANDGWLDTVFYGSKDRQANPAYSLINDTIYYFLFLGSGPNARFQLSNDINFNDYFANKGGFVGMASIPMILDFRIARRSNFFSRCHLYTEVRPFLYYTSIPEIDNQTQSGIGWGFGLSYEI